MEKFFFDQCGTSHIETVKQLTPVTKHSLLPSIGVNFTKEELRQKGFDEQEIENITKNAHIVKQSSSANALRDRLKKRN